MILLRGAIAWSVVIALVVILYKHFNVDDLRDIELAGSELVRKEELLNRLEQLPEREATIRERIQLLNEAAAEKYLYQGGQREAQALILRDVRALAARSNVSIDSMRSIGIRRSTNLISRSAIQVNFVAKNDNLLNFLSEVEAWEPLLRVVRMSVRVRQASTDYQPAELAVMLEVSGFYQSQAGTES